MHPPNRKSPGDDLLHLARDLRSAVSALHPLSGDTGKDSRAGVLLLLEAKALPELEAGLDFPVFAAVLGGTNVGKSTVFNALAGKILSPALVTASATKHPLFSAHEMWRGRFLRDQPYPGVTCRELSDPKELIAPGSDGIVLYFRFHEDPQLEDLALIDSPDLDSALESNAIKASLIGAISDVALFVTTAQKYRDRVLVDDLARLMALKGEVIVVLNHAAEDIVFETISDDLRALLRTPERRGVMEAIRLPPSSARHPEEALREVLAPLVLDRFARLRAAETKPPILARTLRRAAVLAGELAARHESEAAVKKELEALLAEGLEEARDEYRTGFQLSFPEETLAMRKVLRLTELGHRLELGDELTRSRGALAVLAGIIRRVNEAVRLVIVRLSPAREGSIEPTPRAIEEYASARNRADAETVSRLVERCRLRAESFLRAKEAGSAFAKEVLRTHFTPELALGLGGKARSAHETALREARGTGGEIVSEVDGWIAGRPRTARALGASAILFKIACGILLAWVLPPRSGLLAILSPLEWLWFVLGYLLGAYLIALAISLRLRRRKRFREARLRAMEATLRSVFLNPLGKALDAIIVEDRVQEVAKLARRVEESAELSKLDATLAAAPR